jgi:hypothetical protein
MCGVSFTTSTIVTRAGVKYVVVARAVDVCDAD